MLNIPAKMQDALDKGIFSPVGAVKITTAVLDAPIGSQTFVNSSGNIDAQGITDKFNVQQAYPDPSSIGTQVYQAFTNTRKVMQIRSISDPLAAYQTFTLGEDIQQASLLKSVKVLFQLSSSATGGLLRCFIYEADENGNLITGDNNIMFGAGSIGEATNTVAATSLPVSPTAATVQTFNFNLSLKSGVKYAVVFTSTASNSANNPVVLWYGVVDEIGSDERATEWNIASNVQITGGRAKGSLQLDFAAYDSTPTPVLQIQFDLGGVPLSNGSWSIQDRPAAMIDPVTGLRQETSISYHAWSTDATYVKGTGSDLGVIDPSNEADLLISVLSRYYILEATFTATSNGLRTHSFLGANAIFADVTTGEAASYTFSTKNLPFSQAPALEKIPQISFNLSPGKHLSQRSGISATLIDIDGTVTRRMIEANNKNLPIELRIGDVTAQTEDDMVLVFAGKITGFKHEEGRTSVFAEDRTTNLKQKIPRVIPKLSEGGLIDINTSNTRRVFQGQEIIDAVETILKAEVGILSRYIDSVSLADLKTALKASAAVSPWITDLKIKDQTEADNLLKDAMQLAGAYLTVLEDGRLTAIQFPRLGTSVTAWDENVLTLGDIQPESWKLTQKNAVYVVYDAFGDGSQKGIAGYLDHDAQGDWAPGAERDVSDMTIKTKWLGDEATFNGKTTAMQVAKRIVGTQKNGFLIYQCKTGWNQVKVQVGDLVDITTPVFLKKGVLGAKGVQFMVIGKSYGDGDSISFKLVENITSSKLPTASFTATPISGIPTLNVTVNGAGSFDNNPGGSISTWEWDKDYDGTNFTVDATGVTPAAFAYDSTATGIKTIALRVTNALGGQHIATKLIRVLAAPVALINYRISAPDQPLSVALSSGSYGVTGSVSLIEWDLSYDGITFNAESIGNSTTLNLPYQTITVALRVTDEDGQTHIATATFQGKAFAPAQVTGFFVDQTSDKIVFNWDTNAEPDIFAYEIRKGTSWNNSVLIASEILSNSFMTVAPMKAGSHTYLVKAINTTGRYSINATIITITIIDPRNRNVVSVTDRKAQGWPGIKTGLVYEAGNNQWWIGSIDDLVSAETGLVSENTGVIGLRGTRVSGSFEGDPIDLGAVIEGNRLTIDTDSDIIPDPVGTSMVTEFSESNNGVDYTPFAQISAGDLGFRYVRERITINNDDGASNLSIKEDVLTIDVPDVFDSQEDLAVAASGTTTITFGRTFNSTPAIPRPTVNITLQNMTVPLFFKLTNITTISFDITVHRVSDGVQVAGTIDYLAKGF